MSTNLHLEEHGKNGASCDLVHTPTEATEWILKGNPSKIVALRRYFEWLEENWHVGPGQLLDHKLEVAMWIVEHPACKFSAW